ncbi:MAG: hypothetical protein OEV37_01225 [Candidatus Berkelbacteria bacterium]|nr:hypothetical protein [Candidatus Berkelbacteria bacterium]
MKLSPLYELLVILEEKGSVSLRDFKLWPSGTFRGTVGKMESMGLIVKKNIDGLVFFSLSEKGFSYLNRILDVIHNGVSHWDGKWRFVSFSIPEKKRFIRDKFRRYLESIGLKPYLNSLWVSPKDCKSNISKIAERLGVKNYLILICEQTELNQELIKIWDFEKFRKMYEEFIDESENVITLKDKLEAKKMILNYAFILNSEPNLPIELMPNDWPRFRANMQYKKLRRIIE